MTTSPLRPLSPFSWYFTRTASVRLALLAAVLLVAVLVAACAAPAPPLPRLETLEKGRPVERELRGGQRHEYRLELDAGWYARLRLFQPGIDADAVLSDATGETVAGTVGLPGLDEYEVISLVTSRKGEHRLSITPRDARALPGRYRLVLEELRPARSTDGRRVAAERMMDEGRWYGSLPATRPLAMRRYREALSLWKAIGDVRGEVDTLNLQARAYAAGQDAEVIETFELAARRARQARYTAGEAEAVKRLGGFLSTQGRPAEALALYRRSLELWRQVGDRRWQHVVLQNIGQLHLLGAKESQEALAAYRQSLALASTPAERAGALGGIGASYYMLGDFDSALEHLSSARQLIRGTDGNNEGRLLGLIADIYLRRGQIEEALRACSEGLERTKAPDSRAYLLYLQANLLLDLGDLEQALANYQQALDLYTHLGEPGWVDACRAGIGWVRLHQGDLRQALAEYERIDGEEFAYPRALVYWRLHQPARAAGLLEKALIRARTEKDLPKEGEIQLALGAAYRDLGRFGDAVRSLERAADLGRRLDYRSLVAASLFRLATLERDQGGRRALDRARRRAEEALDIVESLRSRVTGRELGASFFASRRAYYEVYADLLLRLDRLQPGRGYREAALAASERARARVLLDLLVESRIAREGHRPGEPGLDAAGADPRAQAASPLGLDQIRALLDEDTALLEYILGAERSTLFVVTRERLEVFSLPRAEAIDDKVHRFRKLVSKRQGRPVRVRAYATLAHDLYLDLIAPASDVLAGKGRLIIAPDRSLYLLPFEALLTAPGAGLPLQEMPFLIHRYSISGVPSASVLARLRENEPQPVALPAAAQPRFVAFADPPPRTEPLFPRLPPLPEARREVTQIARLYGRGARLYQGSEATEDNVKGNGQVATAGYLHFATHSLLDEKQPERSGLVLARKPGSREDGILRAFEVFDLHLSADMVVLSACDSGGKEVTGEGLVGLARAFLYAGTPSVAVSLWKVDDTSSADLMVRFYRELARSGDKAGALRRSKRAMIADPGFAHPFYWSSFVLVGDPGGER